MSISQTKSEFKLTQDELKRRFHYDPKTGIFIRKTTTSSRAKKGDIAGAVSRGYLRVSIFNKEYFLHRLAWLYFYGEWPSGDIDHIDHNRAGNEISNLRIVTHKDNIRNSRRNKDNTSGACGVVWNKSTGKWQAQITVDGKNKYLGIFSNKTDAIFARKEADKRYGFHPNHGS